MAFPLYDTLLAKVKSEPNLSVDLLGTCATINAIPTNMPPEEASQHLEIIAAFILHHEMVNNRGVLLRPTPYGGRTLEGGKGIIYSATNLPPLLQQIISCYISTYSRTS
jgi:hypothetical protein